MNAVDSCAGSQYLYCEPQVHDYQENGVTRLREVAAAHPHDVRVDAPEAGVQLAQLQLRQRPAQRVAQQHARRAHASAAGSGRPVPPAACKCHSSKCSRRASCSSGYLHMAQQRVIAHQYTASYFSRPGLMPMHMTIVSTLQAGR